MSGFELQGVVHLVRPVGLRAQNLQELRVGIAQAPERSLFLHTRQHYLRDPVGAEPAPDDLSAWVGGVVQDRETAERLSFSVQSPAASAEELRAASLAVLDRLPEATRISRDAPADGGLVFLTAESVTLPSGAVVYSCGELVDALERADTSIWFYHVIEQQWFPDGPSLEAWIRELGDTRFGDWFAELRAEGLTIEAMRRRLVRRWRRSRLGARVGTVAGSPEDERREEGRTVVARLARRLARPGSES